MTGDTVIPRIQTLRKDIQTSQVFTIFFDSKFSALGGRHADDADDTRTTRTMTSNQLVLPKARPLNNRLGCEHCWIGAAIGFMRFQR